MAFEMLLMNVVVLAVGYFSLADYGLDFLTRPVEQKIMMMDSLILMIGLLLSTYRGRSVFSIIEGTTVLFVLGYYHTPSLALFYSVKLLVSFATFSISLLDEHAKDAFVLYYFFPLGRCPTMHSAVVFGPPDKPYLYHYRNVDRSGTNRLLENAAPSSLELEPDGVPCKSHAALELPVGLAHVDQHEVVKSKLPVSGKCHNWALHVLYNLSTAKFLSIMTLTFFRWEGWILLLFFLGSSFAAYGLSNSFQIVSSLMDLGLSAVFELDSFNLDSARLQSRRVELRASYRPLFVETTWFLLLMSLYGGTIYWLPSVQLVAGQDFLAFLVTTMLLLGILRLILPRFVLPTNAKQMYDDFMAQREEDAFQELFAKRRRRSPRNSTNTSPKTPAKVK